MASGIVYAALAALLISKTYAVDFEAFLSRHDPIWRWNTSSTVGYTQSNQTIGSGGGACSASRCTSVETCVEESATQCDKCPECAAFALSPAWNSGLLPQLYSSSYTAVPNDQWTLYSKGGPILRNHSSQTSATLTTRWEDGPFLGNGRLGGLVLFDVPNGNASQALMRLQLGRSDVWDHRVNASQNSTGVFLFDRPRLPVGYAHIQPAGAIVSGWMRLSLYNASLYGEITTSVGALAFSLFVHADTDWMVMQVNATGGEVGAWQWSLVPLQGSATRHPAPSNYVPNPAPQCTQPDNSTVRCYQPLLSDPGYAYGVQAGPCITPSPACTNLVFTVANDWPAATSQQTAAQTLLNGTQAMASAASSAQVIADHCAWWAAAYPASFLSVPNTTLEGMYWLQVYKISAASRPTNAPAIDLMGPWFQSSQWTVYWWDLNVQLTAWMIPASNRHGWMAPFVALLYDNVPNLILNANNVSGAMALGGAASYDSLSIALPPSIVGDLPWMLHNLWTFARHTLNDTLMLDVVYPLLRGAVTYYESLLFEGADGALHMVPTESPEYPYPHGPTNDTNYDLALLHWGCITLLQLNTEYGLNDSKAAAWSNVLVNLTPPPTDQNGLMVSAGVPFSIPHRHFSHEFAMYPLHLLTWDVADGGTPASRQLFQTTLDHWTNLSCSGGACLNGFTYDGASSMMALMTDDVTRRQAAVDYLTRFVASGMIHSSTMYSEAGGLPCIESPLAAANSLQEILLQSWGGRVRVFPAVPPSWPDVVFANLSAEGGFLVTAVRANGTTTFINITAPAYSGHTQPRTLTLSTDMPPPLASVPSGIPIIQLPTGDFQLNITVCAPTPCPVMLFPSASPPASVDVTPLPGTPAEFNFWGRK